jgi:hypothetical protein
VPSPPAHLERSNVLQAQRLFGDPDYLLRVVARDLPADLAEHGLEVVLDRERRDAERRSDLLGAAPLGGERGDLPFARGKPVEIAARS